MTRAINNSSWKCICCAFGYLNWNQPAAEVHIQLQIHNWKPSSQIQSINLGQKREMCKIFNWKWATKCIRPASPSIWLDCQSSGHFFLLCWSPDWLAGQRPLFPCVFFFLFFFIFFWPVWSVCICFPGRSGGQDPGWSVCLMPPPASYVAGGAHGATAQVSFCRVNLEIAGCMYIYIYVYLCIFAHFDWFKTIK